MVAVARMAGAAQAAPLARVRWEMEEIMKLLMIVTRCQCK